MYVLSIYYQQLFSSIHADGFDLDLISMKYIYSKLGFYNTGQILSFASIIFIYWTVTYE